MCTICGSVSTQPRVLDDVFQMMNVMRHRGPDSHGIWADGKTRKSKMLSLLDDPGAVASRVLAHSRLSIIDKGCVGQPYAGCRGLLHLVHNGEIYNYRELASLLTRDHERRGDSDSELIVHLIEESYKGDLAEAVRAVAPMLDGMVTMAITDGKVVVLLRDAVGKKPVYYERRGGRTLFASEKKALSNPRRLEPGNMLVVDDGFFQVTEFDRLTLPPVDVIDFDEALDLYKEVFTRAIRKRLSGLMEEHLGVIFSGGVDSVLVAQQLMNEGNRVRCYCAGTEGSGDIEAARSAAEEMGVDLRVRTFTPGEVEDRLVEIIHAVEETGQLQVEVAIPMYLAAEMAAEDGIRVVFTGQGADETQGGYDWYRGIVPEGALALHHRMWEDFRRLYDETLEREDKLTMAHSLEQRAPYLDRALILQSMRISPRLKVRGEDDRMRKWVHRRVATDLGVPEKLAYRKKDPAQTGSGIHGIIEAVAERRHPCPDPRLALQNRRADKGSLFRYEGHSRGSYGSDTARSFLEFLARNLKEEEVPV